MDDQAIRERRIETAKLLLKQMMDDVGVTPDDIAEAAKSLAKFTAGVGIGASGTFAAVGAPAPVKMAAIPVAMGVGGAMAGRAAGRYAGEKLDEYADKLGVPMPVAETAEVGTEADDEADLAGGASQPMPAPVPPPGAVRSQESSGGPAAASGGNGRVWEGYGGYMYRNEPDGSFTIVKAPAGADAQVGLRVTPKTVNRQNPSESPYEAIKAEATKRGVLNG